jgi:hypothetical protein
MLFHLNHNVQISRWAAAAARLSLPTESNLCSVINARWNLNMESLGAVESPLTTTGRALFLDDSTLAAALGTWRLNRHLTQHGLAHGSH